MRRTSCGVPSKSVSSRFDDRVGLVAARPVVGGDEVEAARGRAVDVEVRAVARIVEVAALLVQVERACPTGSRCSPSTRVPSA